MSMDDRINASRFISRFGLIVLPCLTWACEDKEDSESEQDTYIAIIDPPPMVLDVVWGDEQVELVIYNSEYSEYMFGLSETTCEGECWHGEDCVYGDSSGQYFYCHPSGSQGVSLRYGAEPETLQEGKETVFSGSSFEENVTYYVKPTTSDDCWLWGDDVSYYIGLDCGEL